MRILPWIKEKIFKNSFVLKILKSTTFRIKVILILSIIYNLLYVAFNTVYGIIYESAWFITVAVYYSLLIFVSYTVLKAKNRPICFYTEACRQYFLSGVLLIILDIPMTGMMLYAALGLRLINSSNFLFGELIVYAVFNIARVVYSIMRMRKNSSLSERAVYTVRSASALMSVFNLMITIIPTGGVRYVVRIGIACIVSVTVLVLASNLIVNSRAENTQKNGF